MIDQKETLIKDLRRVSGKLQEVAHFHYVKENDEKHAKYSIWYEAVNTAIELIEKHIPPEKVHLETP